MQLINCSLKVFIFSRRNTQVSHANIQGLIQRRIEYQIQLIGGKPTKITKKEHTSFMSI